MFMFISVFSFFFFNDTATTEIYTLSLHDALPISDVKKGDLSPADFFACCGDAQKLSGMNAGHGKPDGDCISLCNNLVAVRLDRKSTRLNSSHQIISYAVFCLKKKKKTQTGINAQK